MKKLSFTFLILLFTKVLPAQLFERWVRPYEQSPNFFQIHEGVMDSNSNYYSRISDAINDQFKIKKIDSLGNELWYKVVWPDSVIPGNSFYSNPQLYLAPNNNLLTFSLGSNEGILKLLDPQGNVIRRSYFTNMSYIGAYPDFSGNYYIMGSDTFRFVHNLILDSTMNVIHHDSSAFAGGGFSNSPFCKDNFGNIFSFYNDSRIGGFHVKVFRYFNEQFVDSFVAAHTGTLVIDKYGYRYIYGYDGTTKYDTSWNVIWNNPACIASDLKFDSQNNFFVINTDQNSSTPVQKFDSNGNLLWSRPFNLPGLISHFPGRLLVDSHDDVLIFGSKFDVPPNGNNDNNKIFISHFNSGGNLIDYYEKYFPNQTYASINDPCINSSDNLTFNIFTDDTIYYASVYNHSVPNVSGHVYFDANANCTQDTNEANLSHVNVYCLPLGAFTQSNDSGNFYFLLPDGNYQFPSGMPPNMMQNCPVPSLSVVNGVANANPSIGLTALPGTNDLQIDFIHPSIRANRDLFVLIHYQNLGTTILDGTINFNYDTIFSYINSVPLADTVQPNHLAWNFSNLFPGEDRYISVVIHSGLYPTGTEFVNIATINSPALESNSIDNLFSIKGSLIGSFDPNEKFVQPRGIGPNGIISVYDNTLTYQIVFQNTGTDTAMYIMVVDTIDHSLDPMSFMLLSTSMPCTYSLSGTGVLKFVFDPCALPDSSTDELNSHGYISYRIKTKHALPNGTLIKNKAEIYFDYNLPIVTNTVINTIDNTLLSVIEPNQMNIFDVFPNPVSDNIYLQLYSSDKSLIRIYSQEGRLILSEVTNEMKHSISSVNFSSGIYFVQVNTAERVQTKKVIILQDNSLK